MNPASCHRDSGFPDIHTCAMQLIQLVGRVGNGQCWCICKLKHFEPRFFLHKFWCRHNLVCERSHVDFFSFTTTSYFHGVK